MCNCVGILVLSTSQGCNEERGLHQLLHPFEEHSFEIFYQGSWKTVERLRISSGTVTFNVLDHGFLFEEKNFLSTLRLRPRRATMTDCTCVLRPGADVAVLSPRDESEDSSEDLPTVSNFQPYLSPTIICGNMGFY